MGYGAGHRGAAPPLDRMGCGLAVGARGAAQRARAHGAADGAIGTADAVTAPGCESGARQQRAPVERNSCHAVGNDVGKTDCRGLANVWHASHTIAGDKVDCRFLCDGKERWHSSVTSHLPFGRGSHESVVPTILSPHSTD